LETSLFAILACLDVVVACANFLLFDLNINNNYLKIAIVLFCREKKKREERVGSQKANEAITKCTGDFLYSGH